MCTLNRSEIFTRAEIREMERRHEEAEMTKLRAVMDSDATPFLDKLEALGRAAELVARAGDRALEAMREARA
jgi:hypothetical protein